MNGPSVIGEQDPPKAWIETIHRSLRNFNTAATWIVEFYPVVFLVKDAGHNVLGGVLGNVVGDGYTYTRCGLISSAAGVATQRG